MAGGTFVFGTDKAYIPQDGEGPAMRVTVAPFYIDNMEVHMMQTDSPASQAQTHDTTHTCCLVRLATSSLHSLWTPLEPSLTRSALDGHSSTKTNCLKVSKLASHKL